MRRVLLQGISRTTSAQHCAALEQDMAPMRRVLLQGISGTTSAQHCAALEQDMAPMRRVLFQDIVCTPRRRSNAPRVSRTWRP